MKHIQRQQFSFRKTRIKVSLKILSLQASSLSLCFKPAFQCLLFSKTNSREENCWKLSFTARIITKYSLDRFLSICGEKLSKGFLKFCKLISNLILGQMSFTNSRGSRVAGRGSKVAVAGPMSRSQVQSRGRGSNVAAGENDLGFEVTAEWKRLIWTQYERKKIFFMHDTLR